MSSKTHQHSLRYTGDSVAKRIGCETKQSAWQFALLTVCTLALSTGCRFCASCEDLDYPAYGGAWERTLRQQGRVASVFDPGGAKAASLVDRDAPLSIDSMDRTEAEDSPLNGLDMQNEAGQDDNFEPRPGDRERELRGKSLDDIENEREQQLRERRLEDIEVNIIPSNARKLISTQK